MATEVKTVCERCEWWGVWDACKGCEKPQPVTTKCELCGMPVTLSKFELVHIGGHGMGRVPVCRQCGEATR